MARTQEQILAQINEEADRHASLAELQRHTSRISVWRHIKQSTAFAIRTIEEMLDTHSAEVEARLNRQRIGTRAWYAEQALRYQHGQKVALIDGRPGYATDLPEAQIIRHLAVEEATGAEAGTMYVKVVKGDPAGGFEAMTSAELTAFSAYMEALSFAGIQVVASSAMDTSTSVAGTIQIDPHLNLSASKITSKTLSTSRITSLSASKINSDEFNENRIPEITKAKLSSVQAILDNNLLFFSTLAVPSVEGA